MFVIVEYETVELRNSQPGPAETETDHNRNVRLTNRRRIQVPIRQAVVRPGIETKVPRIYFAEYSQAEFCGNRLCGLHPTRRLSVPFPGQR